MRTRIYSDTEERKEEMEGSRWWARSESTYCVVDSSECCTPNCTNRVDVLRRSIDGIMIVSDAACCSGAASSMTSSG